MTTVTASGIARAVVVTANGSETALTTATLAARLNHSIQWTEELLAESEADGIVESADGAWRLSDEAEHRFGRALRGLTLACDGLEVPAGGNAW